MEIIQTIITGIVSGAGASAALVWLTKTWISERIKGAIKSEYEAQLETHKDSLRRETELIIAKQKGELELAIVNTTHALDLQKQEVSALAQQLTKRDEIQFTRFHEARATHIAILFESIVCVESLTQAYLRKEHISSEDDIVLNAALKDATAYSAKTKIYFSKSLGLLLSKVLFEIQDLAVQKYIWSIESGDSLEDVRKCRDQAEHLIQRLETHIKPVLEQIEDQYRLLLGANYQ